MGHEQQKFGTGQEQQKFGTEMGQEKQGKGVLQKQGVQGGQVLQGQLQGPLQGQLQGQYPQGQGLQQQGRQYGITQQEKELPEWKQMAEEEFERGPRTYQQGELQYGQEEQGVYTQRGGGGWTPPQGQTQFGRMQAPTQEFQGGGVYRGGEWKQEREETPLIIHAPSGPMPGKTRMGPVARTQEERERARRFGFPPTRLLVLTDGSENSHRALEAALHFRRRNDMLFILNAVQLMDDTIEYDQTNRLLKDKGRKIIDEVTKLIHEREIGRWECASLPSKNAKQIALDYASKNNVELIFIGCRGVDSKTGDFYPGSFSKFVINNSHCSVMLVR